MSGPADADVGLGKRLLFLGLGSVGFFLYSFINHLPRNALVAHHLATGLDRLIPLVPVFVVPYGLAMVFVVATLIYHVLFTERMQATACSYAFCLLTSCFVYLVFQTTVDRPSIESDAIFSRLVALLYAVDRPYNCFPSLHVSLSVLAGLIWAERSRRVGGGMIAVVLLVSLSTLLIRQHVLLDVLSGVALGGLSYCIGNSFGAGWQRRSGGAAPR